MLENSENIFRRGNELARQIHTILHENNATIEVDEKASYLVLGGRKFWIEVKRA